MTDIIIDVTVVTDISSKAVYHFDPEPGLVIFIIQKQKIQFRVIICSFALSFLESPTQKAMLSIHITISVSP